MNFANPNPLSLAGVSAMPAIGKVETLFMATALSLPAEEGGKVKDRFESTDKIDKYFNGRPFSVLRRPFFAGISADTSRAVSLNRTLSSIGFIPEAYEAKAKATFEKAFGSAEVPFLSPEELASSFQIPDVFPARMRYALKELILT